MTIADVKSARTIARSAKIAYTTRLSQLATKKNAGLPVSNADWADLIVNFYDPLTAATNDLGVKIDALADTVVATTSPDGAAALPPSGKIQDAHGDVWSFGSNAGGEDFAVLLNGATFQGNIACLITIFGGAIWTRDSLNNWWTRDATGKLVTSLLAPYGVNPLNVRSFNTHDGATIVASSVATSLAGQAFLIDMNVAKWTFGAQAANGKDFVIMRNGLPFSEPGFTTKPYEALMLRLKNGVAWMQNAAGSWVYPPI